MGKFEALLFGHLLDFERKDAQLIENGFHTIWQHAQILCTNQHPAIFQYSRQPFEGLLSPEERMALIEIVVV